MTDTIPTLEVFEEPIELCKLLKIANMVSGGGEAKIVISEGYVYLNGEIETQKRKKVYQGDIVEFNGELFAVTVNATKQIKKTVQEKNKPKVKSKTKEKNSKAKNKATTDFSNEAPIKHKRKPISF
jgi:ribosome-associated protein